MRARQEQPILTLSANFAQRGDSLLAVVRGLLLPPAVGPGCLLHPFAACSAAGEQRNILSPRQVPPAAVALRNAPAGAALCAPAVFAPRFARLRGDSLLVGAKVATSTHSPPVRRRVNRGTSYLRAKCRLRRLRSETRLRAQRSALRLFLHRASRDCAAIACWWGPRLLPPPIRRLFGGG